jgi:hypothetical protein
MKRLLATAAVLLLGLSVGRPTRAQTDPFLGTWKLNLAKSKFEPGPAPKSETRIVVTGPSGMNVSVDRLRGDGTRQEFEYTTNLDGKNYPIVGDGPEGADAISASLKGPNTMQVSISKNHRNIGTATISVSADGKSLTIKSAGTGANGVRFKNEAVYDKL